ncbi:TadE/TadG family type IV pilus assembly protein [Saliterribacillus persicus]|uniref:TadE-like protein n=1 Tax=Saliterribacillus persicus TaxID=930114 RepID=A0A368XCX2_9BACI|nr:TadE family protein [Saliterribacillus persicus]RCW65832.1 TadE-like protein [Saliterribacillus persicus]
MKKFFKQFQNENGALSFEFLGILPLFFMLFIILWQVVASGYAIHTVQSAANEGAKIFAATQDINEAQDAVQQSIGSSDVLNYSSMNVVTLNGNGKFKLNVEAEHYLIFVPDVWRSTTSFSLEESIVSQVLVQ